MTATPIVPAGMQYFYDDWHMSPGLACNGFVFLTGVTGESPDGTLAKEPETQFRQAFAAVASILEAGGTDVGSIVEMTSYHVGLRGHIDVFRSVRDEFVREPYPAWTAIEVVGLISEDAIVELRVIARQT